MATTILLARHGETAWNRELVFRGTHDIALNENGRRQGELLAGALVGRHIAAAYASPLGRAVETAELALAGRSVSIKTDERLRDFCYGDWQGITEAQVKVRWPKEYAAWVNEPQSLRVPGGDTLAEVSWAAFAALEQWAGAHEGQTIAVFAHRVVNKLLVLAALGLPLERFRFIRQDNCSLNELERGENGYTIVCLNNTTHLRQDEVGLLSADF